MKRILVGFIMDGNAGGIDKYLLNFLEVVKSEKVQVDFLTNEIHTELQEYLNKYHSKIYAISNLKHPQAQYRQVRKIIREGKYEIVYLNISTAIDCIAAMAATHEHVDRVMIHSHSSGNDCENTLKRKIFNGIHYFCRLFLYRYATEYYGCSYKAGEWMFPKRIVNSDKFQVIYNAVDRSAFEYNEQIRNEIRKELSIEDCFVIGNVGNFCYQKNHTFLIDVFYEIKKREPHARLLLAGDGVRMEMLKERVRSLKLEKEVLFLGRRRDVARLYQGMDVFVLPSNFEGLPIAGIEAQSSGLPCIMSSAITRESKIVKACNFISPEKKPQYWAEEILRCRGGRKKAEFLDCAVNYDLQNQQKQLKELI